jgi:hypothetical protein
VPARMFSRPQTSVADQPFSHQIRMADEIGDACLSGPCCVRHLQRTTRECRRQAGRRGPLVREKELRFLNWTRPRAVNAAVQSEYAWLAGMSPAALTAAMEPYLPIIRVFALLAGVWPAQWERLIQRVEATLRSEDE